MEAIDLIYRLQELREEYGDLPVRYKCDAINFDGCEVNYVEYNDCNRCFLIS